MNQLLELWAQWTEGVVPPDTLLWGLELYWWNRLAIALQAVALVVVFFELIGSDRRQRLATFFEFDAYHTMVSKVGAETKKFIAASDISIRSALLSATYSALQIARFTLKRLFAVLPGAIRKKTENLKSPLNLALLKLHHIDRKQSARFKRLEIRLLSYRPIFRLRTQESVMTAAIAGLYLLLMNHPAFNLGLSDFAYALPIICLVMALRCYAIMDLPLYFAASTTKVAYYVCSPLFKRLFHTKYEPHWIAAVLASGLIGLHFSILIG